MFQLQDPPPGVDGMEFSLMQLAARTATDASSDSWSLHRCPTAQRQLAALRNRQTPLEDSSFTQTAKGIRVLRVYAIGGRKLSSVTAWNAREVARSGRAARTTETAACSSRYRLGRRSAVRNMPNS
jgi:hypothetical protein